MNVKKQLMEGLLTRNPVLVQALGLCSALAVSTTLLNGLGMGLTVTVVLTLTNVMISALRNFVAPQIRLLVFVVVIAGFVTAVDLLLQAFLPGLSRTLEVFLPLVTVNCMVLGRAEAFAYHNDVAASALDGVSQGLGYTVVLLILSAVRELLGTGTIGAGLWGEAGQGLSVIPAEYSVGMLGLPVGGLLVLAALTAAAQWLLARRGETKGADR